MNKKKKFIALSLILAWQVFLNPDSAKAEPGRTSAYYVVRMLDQLHVQPPFRDEYFYNSIKHDFPRNLDPSGLFFTTKDVREIESMKLDESDLKDLQQSPFFSMALSLYEKRTAKVGETISSILENGLDYTQEGLFEYQRRGDTEYLETDEELKSRWERMIKYRILNLAFLQSRNEKSIPPLKYFQTHRQDIEKKVKRMMLEDLEDTLHPPGGISQQVAVTFIKTIGWLYDSHTEYMTLNERKNYKESLSRESMSFGIILKKELTGETRIAQVVPSGAAWKSRRIEKNDILIAIGKPGTNNYYEIVETRVHRINRLLEAQRLEFVIEKKDGTRITVPLEKGPIPSRFNVVDAFVLKGKKNVGYISLPTFYSDLTDTGKGGCTEDVARAVLHLRKEKINALILDLRGNGGGLVHEAVKLSGLFINEGPIFLDINNKRELRVVKDSWRGTVFDGPMIVLVDSNSASASELLTGALRNYNRAVVVGSRTYGKATEQTWFPLVRDLSELQSAFQSPMPHSESINISQYVMYNLNGNSHQGGGIQPDIELPHPSQVFSSSEEKMPHPLKVDRVPHKISYQQLPDTDIRSLVKLSESRIGNDPDFKQLKGYFSQMEKEFGPESTMPMTLSGFFKSAEYKWQTAEKMNGGLKKSSSDFAVINHSAQNELLNRDEDEKERNLQLIQLLQNDIYLDEVYHIALDMIDLKKK